MPNPLIYTPTKSLDVNYAFNFSNQDDDIEALIPASDIHARLRAACDGLLTTRSDLRTKKGRAIYTADIEHVNIAVAELTVLFSDTLEEEGYLGEEVLQESMPIYVVSQKNRIISSLDFYNDSYFQVGVATSKAKRNLDFNVRLSARLSAFSSVASNYDSLGAISNSTDFREVLSSPMFHETYHHSEQALMHYLSGSEGIESIVQLFDPDLAQYAYGVVLDIYTQRMLCCNCNACLLGLQHSQSNGFIADLNEALESERISTREDGGTMLSIRVSASKPCHNKSLSPLELPDDQGCYHEYDPDERNTIFQAKNSTLGTAGIIREQQYSLSSYAGSFFTSSNFSKERLESDICRVNLGRN